MPENALRGDPLPPSFVLIQPFFLSSACPLTSAFLFVPLSLSSSAPIIIIIACSRLPRPALLSNQAVPYLILKLSKYADYRYNGVNYCNGLGLNGRNQLPARSRKLILLKKQQQPSIIEACARRFLRHASGSVKGGAPALKGVEHFSQKPSSCSRGLLHLSWVCACCMCVEQNSASRNKSRSQIDHIRRDFLRSCHSYEYQELLNHMTS